jgi:hypothetical protein
MTIETHDKYFWLIQSAIEKNIPDDVYSFLEQLSKRHLGKRNGITIDEFGHLRSGFYPGFNSEGYQEYVDGTIIPIEYLRWHYEVGKNNLDSVNFAEKALLLNSNQKKSRM